MLCPNCKKEIPDGTTFCPDCGASVSVSAQPAKKQKKPITKKWWFWVIIVVVVIGLISAVSGGGDDTSAPTSSESTSQSQSEITTKVPESTTEKTTFNVGETVNDGVLAITYVSAEEWKGYSQYLGPETGNKIVRLKFDFANNGEVDAYINSFYCYADNQAAKDYYGGDEMLSTFTISAGRTTSGYVYFEVPENAEEIEVEYEVNAWTDKKAVFTVEL